MINVRGYTEAPQTLTAGKIINWSGQLKSQYACTHHKGDVLEKAVAVGISFICLLTETPIHNYSFNDVVCPLAIIVLLRNHLRGTR